MCATNADRVKTYRRPVRIVPKRAIFTIAGELTVTLRQHIADKDTIICYVVVEAIVSRPSIDSLPLTPLRIIVFVNHLPR